MPDPPASARPAAPPRPRARELDLLLALDRAAPAPLRAQLEDAVRTAVADGRLAHGTALPSTRALAAELAVSRGVVVEAYAQLAADGVLEIRPGGATRVARLPPPRPAAPVAPAATPPAPDGAVVDLLPMSGDLVSFPRRAWARAVRRALDDVPAPGLSYGDLRGPEPARVVLAAYLGRSRGVLADAETTAFTAGVTEGLAVLARALAGRGVRRIAVEDPGFVPHRRTLQDAGLEPVPVPVDEDGLRTADLAAQDVGAVLVTPAHQSPTGRPLATPRRAELVRWAADGGRLVIEDDYDGEFRYDRRAVGALQALAPDHVAYAGSVSKTLAPALRIGWLVAPRPLLDEATLLRGVATGGTPVLEPLALAALIDGGDYDRHLRARRREYATRRTAVLDALERVIPDGEVLGIDAGLAVCVRLDATVEPGRLSAEAFARGVVVAATASVVAGRPVTLLHLGFGRAPLPALRRAVAEVGAVVDGLRPPGGRRGPAQRSAHL